jgi:hypothetical protein
MTRWGWGIAAAVFVALGSGFTSGQAGELRNSAAVCKPGGNGAQGCTWASTTCKRPDAPMLYVASRDDLDHAAGALNKYAGDLNAYMACVSGEGQTDLNALLETVKAGVEKAQAGAKADFDKQRSQLEAARLRLQLQ